MSKNFASAADLDEKKVSFEKLGEGLYAYTAEGDPNTGIIIGDDGVMVIDTQATPTMAQDVIRRIREVTDLPIKYVLMSHYHAVRVMGASAYNAEQIIASKPTYDLIVERGEHDFKSEVGRFPRLFNDVESVPGLTWPTMVFEGKMTIFMGKRRVEIIHAGRGHTAGDTIAWLPDDGVLFSGDLVEFGATPYTGDAHLEDWPKTLDYLRSLKPEKLVPGRGAALMTPELCEQAIAETQDFLESMYGSVKKGREEGKELGQIYKDTYAALKPKFGDWVIFDHCLPFDVTRAYDEAGGLDHPRIWTDERDVAMWKALEEVE
ncbi:MBL fold metallo-hydrolase [Terasakiella sp. SH-1]|uniref:MBL fold metallo-hydrolase n=1 Tax=Terasakiella sp. SH-1 TaxID=2560057 RepID=UPI0010749879|nr:MBL fold metallo-hydrolase [Terasakiella sp. SH-1]